MLIDIETSSPPFSVTQLKAAEEFKKRTNSRAAQRFIDTAAVHSGIEKRHIIIPDAEENSNEHFYSRNGNEYTPDTRLRMVEYENWAKQLSIVAVEKLFKASHIHSNDINRIITISCTGFYAPGLDYDLIKHFNIPVHAKRTNIGFMGCAAALIGFNSVMEILKSAGNEPLNILMVAVELCSLHLHLEPTRDNILSNMIFADGAAAALFSTSASATKKMEIIYADSILFDDSNDLMGWKIGNKGFEMILSPRIPELITSCAVPAIKENLKAQGLSPADIQFWALHPGGRAILDALQQGLNLSDNQMIPSREVLKYFGNMSSASILFVLKNIMETGGGKGLCCAVAFGPGLTMEMVILKVY